MQGEVNKNKAYKYALIAIAAVLAISVAMVSVCHFNGSAYADEVTTTYRQVVGSESAEVNLSGGSSHLNSWGNKYSSPDLVGVEYILEFNYPAETTIKTSFCQITRGALEDSFYSSFSFGFLQDGAKYYFLEYKYPTMSQQETVCSENYPVVGDYMALTFTEEKLFISYYNSYNGYDTTKYEESLNNILVSYDNTTTFYNDFVDNFSTKSDVNISFYADGYGRDLEGFSCKERFIAYKNMEVPVKEGHTFVGWYYDQEFTRPYNGEAIEADTNLYAKYEINKYTVTYDCSELDDSNDPNNTGLYDKVVEVVYGSVLDYVPDTVSGKIFLGWYYEDGSKYEGTPVKSNMTLIGKWRQARCTITFDFGDKEGTLEPMEVEYGSKVDLPYPTSGDFKVWYWEDSSNPAWNEDEPVTSDLALVATWEKYIFTVTFYVDTEVWKEVKVEKGKTLGSVALSESIDSNSVVGYENLNTETIATTFAEFAIEDDVAVYLSEVSNVDTPADGSPSLNAWQVFWNNVKAFFDKIGQWFKNLFSKFKK